MITHVEGLSAGNG